MRTPNHKSAAKPSAETLRVLLAVDPSLSCSGWALFSLSRGRLLAVGKIRSLAPSVSLALRLADLQEKIAEVFKSLRLGPHTVLVCEAPTTMRDPRAAFKVEQVRCIFETVARQRSVRVPGRINPRSVHFEILGLRGRQQKRSVVKEAAVGVVQALYRGTLTGMGFPTSTAALKKHQDIVDAILVGSLAVERVKSANRAGVLLEELFDSGKQSTRQQLASAREEVK